MRKHGKDSLVRSPNGQWSFVRVLQGLLSIIALGTTVLMFFKWRFSHNSIEYRLRHPISPLSFKTLDDKHQIQRTADSSDFKEMMDPSSAKRLCIIKGPKGCGKSALAQQTIDSLVKAGTKNVCYCNLEQGFGAFSMALNVFPKWCYPFSKPPENPNAILEATTIRLTTEVINYGESVVLIVDGANRAYYRNPSLFLFFLDAMKSLIDAHLCKIVFITSEGEGLAQIADYFQRRVKATYSTGDFNDRDAEAYLKTWGLEKHQKSICEVVGNRVLSLEAICEKWESINKRKESNLKGRILGSHFEESGKSQIDKALGDVAGYYEKWLNAEASCMEETKKVLDALGDLKSLRSNLGEHTWGILAILIRRNILVESNVGVLGYENKAMEAILNDDGCLEIIKTKLGGETKDAKKKV